MIRLARAAWVIARRDYVATVFTRTFILFLIGPLLPILFAGLFGALVPNDADREPVRPIVVQASPADFHLLLAARARVAARLGPEWLPPLTEARHAGSVRLSGDAAAPELSGPREALSRLKGPIGLLVDTARAVRAGAPDPVAIRLAATSPAPVDTVAARRVLARGAQFGLFFITLILAGMLISNLVEEKSSKVIEVLAAAVPVDAIFIGKLLGMLAVSLTGIAVWGTGGLAIAALALPHGTLATPALGWPAFVGLAMLYWVLLYLLLGALYLGIGAQAATVREVQTLSLPLTLVQLLFFGLAQAAVGQPDGAIGLVAAAVPWSSPFAMIARAAEQPIWWPHLAGIAWQLAWLALVIRLAARLFRRTVLKSGGQPRKSGFLAYISRRRRAT